MTGSSQAVVQAPCLVGLSSSLCHQGPIFFPSVDSVILGIDFHSSRSPMTAIVVGVANTIGSLSHSHTLARLPFLQKPSFVQASVYIINSS